MALPLLSSCIQGPYEKLGGLRKEVSSLSSSSAEYLPEGPLENGDVAVTSSSAMDMGMQTGSGYSLYERVTPEGFLEIGKAEAPLLLTVYTNHACDYCQNFMEEQFPRLQHDFIHSGSLRVRIILVPLQKYPDSFSEAASVYCSAIQAKGLLVHHALFSLSKRTAAGINALLNTFGLDQQLLNSCLTNKSTQNMLENQKQMLQNEGITLVPTFAIDTEKRIGLPWYPDLRGWIETKQRAR